MRRYVICEGPDGSGKSTLTDELCRLLGTEKYHAGGPIQSKEEYYERLETAENKLKDYILDRTTHISETVYSELRDGLYIDDNEYQKILERLLVMNPVIVYTRLETSDEMLGNMKTEGKSYKSPEHFAQVKQGYERILSGYDNIINRLENIGFDVVKFNYKTDDIQHLIDKIKRT